MATVPAGGFNATFSLGSAEAGSVAANVLGALNAALATGILTRADAPSTPPASGQGLAFVTAPGNYVAAQQNTALIVGAGAGAVGILGSSATGNMILVDTAVGTPAAPFVYNTNGGSGTLVTGDGTAVIGTGTAPSTASFRIQTGAGNDTILAFSGNNTIAAGGGSNVIGTGAAGTTSNNLVFAAGNDTISGGGGKGSDIVIAGGGTTYVTPGNKNLTFIGTTGAATIIGGTGQEYVALGAGGGQAGGGSAGPNALFGGTGSAGSTLFGGANGDVLFARGPGSTVLVAGAGNETLQGGGSTGNNTFITGSGGAVIGSGSGNDVFSVAGTGNATINGGAGQDIYQFAYRPSGSATTVIVNNFKASTDKILLSSFAQRPGGAAVTFSPANGGSLAVLADGTKITFVGAVVTLNAVVTLP